MGEIGPKRAFDMANKIDTGDEPIEVCGRRRSTGAPHSVFVSDKEVVKERAHLWDSCMERSGSQRRPPS